MKMVDARAVVQTGFPPTEGVRLAEALLGEGVDLSQVEVDLATLPAELLISPFFNAFLQTVYDREPSLLEQARRVHWHVAYDFQRENIKCWMHEFVPYTPKGGSTN